MQKTTDCTCSSTKVNKLVSSGRPNEHPEIDKPEPKRRKSKGEREEIQDMAVAAMSGDLSDAYGNAVKPQEVEQAVEKGSVLRKRTPTSGNFTP